MDVHMPCAPFDAYGVSGQRKGKMERSKQEWQRADDGGFASVKRELSRRAAELSKLVERASKSDRPIEALLQNMRDRRAHRKQHSQREPPSQKQAPDARSTRRQPSECALPGADTVTQLTTSHPPWLGPLAVGAAAVVGLLSLRARRRARLHGDASTVPVQTSSSANGSAHEIEAIESDLAHEDDMQCYEGDNELMLREDEQDLSHISDDSACCAAETQKSFRSDTAFKPSLSPKGAKAVRAKEPSPPASPKKSGDSSAGSDRGAALPYVELSITINKMELSENLNIDDRTMIRACVDLVLQGTATTYARQKAHTDWASAGAAKSSRGSFAFILPQSASDGELQVRVGAECKRASLANFGVYLRQLLNNVPFRCSFTLFNPDTWEPVGSMTMAVHAYVP